MKRLLLAGVFALATFGSATAGPVSDFEDVYRQMYGAYRIVLFKTNLGDVGASTEAMTSFTSQLDALSATYGAAPPPHYEDDPHWDDTMAEVTQLAAATKALIDAGELAEAHEVLEAVREAFSALHIRNGIQTFSDRMNAYHAEMEHLLALDMATLDAKMMTKVHERAAVMSYLAAEVIATPPADATGNDAYAKLVADFDISVSALLDAVRSGDPDAVKAAVGKVKKPYSLLFVKFG
ncbi:hypothetical protein TG4357_00606 [Thalassovita gelatinovora]|uniref:Uncharacterized protein n=1 Tax=Thalassovita gelatinovora TaxID=53501 RepID=A0A0P1FVG3_THAGE|nr:hypothetical protein [Thalassovita gelatinovora]QIZ80870.1 hypothetical protein HFZ77_10500 [Thalassovita gelatinovora]CUH63326.1 hypothetical protein TG4357_00606 [Thalassovita gelatinovora]SEQ65233.1 hypothetical protein SAMN04488043_107109 [Thalassovita gelatinovora]